MTNASTAKKSTAKPVRTTAQRIKDKRDARRMKYTSVMVPMVGWQRPEPFDVTHPMQRKTLRQVLKRARKHKRPLTIGVHGEDCQLTLTVMPMLVDAQDVDELMFIVAERDEMCTCMPSIMYTGARA